MTSLPLEPLPPRPADIVSPPDVTSVGLRGVNAGDRVYRAALTALALTLPLLLLALVGELVANAWPSIQRFGLRFAWTSVWDPVAGVFGAAPLIWGTLPSSLLALLRACRTARGRE